MICNKCGNEISDTAKFCPKCGSPGVKPKGVESDAPPAQVKKCPFCGAENPLSAKFCRIDGHALSSANSFVGPSPDAGQASKGLLCPICGTENPLTAKFCKKDGASLQVLGGAEDSVIPCEEGSSFQFPNLPADAVLVTANTITEVPCPVCGTANSVTSKFCRKDGAPLPGIQSEAKLSVMPIVGQQEYVAIHSTLEQSPQDETGPQKSGEQEPAVSGQITPENLFPPPDPPEKDALTTQQHEDKSVNVLSTAATAKEPSSVEDTHVEEMPDSQLVDATSELICPTCGTENSLTAKFCKKDGVPLQGNQSEPKTPALLEVEQSKSGSEKLGANHINQTATVTGSSDKQPAPPLQDLAMEATKSTPTHPEKVAGTYPHQESLKVSNVPSAGMEKDTGIAESRQVAAPSAATTAGASSEIACPVCGTMNLCNARFCKKDGTLLQGVAAVAGCTDQKGVSDRSKETRPTQTVPPVPRYREPKKSGSRKWLWTSLVLVLLLAGGGAGYYFYQHADEQMAGNISTNQPLATIPDKQPGEPGLKPETEPPINPSGGNQADVAPGTGENVAPQVTTPATDSGELEKKLNKALKNKGIKGVYGNVSSDLVATLEGTTRNQNEKVAALRTARAIEGISEVKSRIQVKKTHEVAVSSRAADPAKLEGELNRALRNQGLSGITAVVSDNFDVKLKGSVGSSNEKDRAISVAKNFNGVSRVRDMIFVVE